jgi:hypothetical protein
MAWCGGAGLGAARTWQARHGQARQGVGAVWLGEARQARHGTVLARQGAAWPGTAGTASGCGGGRSDGPPPSFDDVW